MTTKAVGGLSFVTSTVFPNLLAREFMRLATVRAAERSVERSMFSILCSHLRGFFCSLFGGVGIKLFPTFFSLFFT